MALIIPTFISFLISVTLVVTFLIQPDNVDSDKEKRIMISNIVFFAITLIFLVILVVENLL